MDEIYNELITKIDEDRVLLNEPMSKHTTFKIGGPADIFVKVTTIEELEGVLELSKKRNISVTVIGNGSNILVTDKGIRGITVKLFFDEIEFADGFLTVGAGVLLPKLARVAYEKELTGVEFLSGIPGSVGGAIFMNSGAYGGQISDVIVETTFIDENLNVRTVKKEELEFSYRKSIFQDKNWIIIGTKLKLERGNKEEIKNKMEEYSFSRKEKQPLDMPSAGSVFKRGENYISAKLIDECELKGLRIGDAKISEKHAGFIVNTGNATADNVLNLIDKIKEIVKEKFNVDLETEIKILGEI